MTYEYAAYFKILAYCGYTDELSVYVDKALNEQEPLSDIILELSFAGNDVNKILLILNNYIVNADISDIDYDNAVFNLIMAFLKRKYIEGSMSMKDITDLMYRISQATDRYLDEPWFTMNVIGEIFDEAEAGYFDMSGYQQTFDAYINDKICLSDYKDSPAPYHNKKESFAEKILKIIKKYI